MYSWVIWALGFTNNATRDSPGIVSLRNCKRFAIRSDEKCDNPVTFAPGRAKLSTNLLPIGSGTKIKTIGIVLVASLRASDATPPLLTIDIQRYKFGRHVLEAFGNFIRKSML